MLERNKVFPKPEHYAYIYYNEVLDFELIEDGGAIQTGSGWATLGYMSGGMKGAMAGKALGGETKMVCNSLQIKVLVKNGVIPARYCTLINLEIKKDGREYKNKYRLAQNILAKLNQILVASAAQVSAVQVQSTVPQQVMDGKKIIEQLREYKALLDEGILTQEEFDTKKKELLELKEYASGENASDTKLETEIQTEQLAGRENEPDIKYDIVIKDIGENKELMVGTLAVELGIKFDDGRRILSRIPCIAAAEKNYSDALRLVEVFNGRGAVAEIVDAGSFILPESMPATNEEEKVDETIQERTKKIMEKTSQVPQTDIESNVDVEIEGGSFEEKVKKLCEAHIKKYGEKNYKITPKIIKGLGVESCKEIYLAHDDTLFKNGKNGFAITDTGIFCRIMGHDTVFSSYDDLASAKEIRWDSKDRTCVVVDGREVTYCCGSTDTHRNDTMALIENVCKLAGKDRN